MTLLLLFSCIQTSLLPIFPFFKSFFSQTDLINALQTLYCSPLQINMVRKHFYANFDEILTLFMVVLFINRCS